VYVRVHVCVCMCVCACACVCVLVHVCACWEMVDGLLIDFIVSFLPWCPWRYFCRILCTSKSVIWK
jgi:hypothetical protein